MSQAALLALVAALGAAVLLAALVVLVQVALLARRLRPSPSSPRTPSAGRRRPVRARAVGVPVRIER